ncbi:MAG: phosphotransferase [Acidimicrobiales bacterium]
MLSGAPEHPVTLCDALRRLVEGVSYDVVWANDLGGLTLRVERGSAPVYVKWLPAASGNDVAGEVERLAWASPYTPVPRVVEQGRDPEGSWFVSMAIDGESAVSPRWLADPATATAAIGAGLRALHDALPRGDCPFTWSARHRLSTVDQRRQRGELDHLEWSDEHAGLTLESALADLARVPSEDLVVCHGDACAPNTLIGEDGRWVGHVDLDQLGVGDRWSDLAVAAWSTEWNYGPGLAHHVYDAYGMAPEPEKIRYYRLLWELG